MGMMYFEDLDVGDTWVSSECAVDYNEMLTYGQANDPWPIHVNRGRCQVPIWGINRQWRLHDKPDVPFVS